MGVGSTICGVGVALGAFGAHSLKSRVDGASLAVFQTGVQYQLVHGLALLAVAANGQIIAPKKLVLIARLWTLGVVLFSGSLYVLSISGVKILGAITPLGGVCFLTGWILLAVEALRKSVDHEGDSR